MATRLHWTVGERKVSRRKSNLIRLEQAQSRQLRRHPVRSAAKTLNITAGRRLRWLASGERCATERHRGVHAPGRGRGSPPPRALPAILLHPDRRNLDGNQWREHADSRRKWRPNPARNAPPDPQSVLQPRALPGRIVAAHAGAEPADRAARLQGLRRRSRRRALPRPWPSRASAAPRKGAGEREIAVGVDCPAQPPDRFLILAEMQLRRAGAAQPMMRRDVPPRT